MKKVGIMIILFVLVGIAITIPCSVFADPSLNPIGNINPQGTGVGNGTANPASGGIVISSVDQFIVKITTLVNWFAWFIALMSVVMGLYAGFLYITAQGETSKLATAHKTLLWAIVGIAVAMISFSIIIITKTFFAF